MWIQEPPSMLQELGLIDPVIDQFFLYKENNIYIMDNHRSAAWCWLQHIPKNNNGLIHIDAHNDALDNDYLIDKLISSNKIDLAILSFEDYLNIKLERTNDTPLHLFRWDNFIATTAYAVPKIFSKIYFSVQENGGTISKHLSVEQIDFKKLISNDGNSIFNGIENWILDIDIDFVFDQNSTPFGRLYNDKHLEGLADFINANSDKFKVITIALSPTCCDGWGNSTNAAKVLTDALGISFYSELQKCSSWE